jgi:hypothetical protein
MAKSDYPALKGGLDMAIIGDIMGREILEAPLLQWRSKK